MSAVPQWSAVDAWALFDLRPMIDGGQDAYLQAVADRCAVWFRVSGASVFVRDDGAGVYRLRARAGRHDRIPAEAVIVPGQGVAGLVVDHGEPRLIGDLANEPDFTAQGVEPRSDVACALVAPLRDGSGDVVGVLNLARSWHEPRFTEADLAQVVTIASHIGLAVGNARLWDRLVEADRERDRLQRLAEVGQMTAAIAHEIRNPLTGIIAAADLAGQDPTLTPEMLAVVTEEAQKLNALCDDFLEFARPLALRLSDARLADIAHRVVALAQADAEHAGVDLLLETCGQDPTMELDVTRVEQVLRNLVRNAIQATPPGGTVRVTTAGGVMTVEDDGCGMSEDQLQRLFTPFFTTKADGTGLGLCNTRKIVDAHGGTVRVRSRQGLGTRFDVNWKGNTK